jgi:hypothetical protein
MLNFVRDQHRPGSRRALPRSRSRSSPRCEGRMNTSAAAKGSPICAHRSAIPVKVTRSAPPTSFVRPMSSWTIIFARRDRRSPAVDGHSGARPESTPRFPSFHGAGPEKAKTTHAALKLRGITFQEIVRAPLARSDLRRPTVPTCLYHSTSRPRSTSSERFASPPPTRSSSES